MGNKEIDASLAGNNSLGGTLPVHRLGFGAMRLTGEGIWGPPKDRKKALSVLRRAVALGVNFIDTADSYGPHVSAWIASIFTSCTYRIHSYLSMHRSRLWPNCNGRKRFDWSGYRM
jgi:hypothetical protein